MATVKPIHLTTTYQDPTRIPLLSPGWPGQAQLRQFTRLQRRIRRLRMILLILLGILFGYTLYALCAGFNQLEFLDHLLNLDVNSGPLFVDTTARVAVFMLLLLAIPVGLAAIIMESFTGSLMLAVSQLCLVSLLFLIQPPDRMIALKCCLGVVATLSIWYGVVIRKRRALRLIYV